jgi:hypothetical protein
MKIEAIFGGILALVVLAVAIFAVTTTSFGPGSTTPTIPSGSGSSGAVINAAAADVECQCFNQAFDLAGKDVGVMSSQYRTGFEQCRAVAGVSGGDAWTAGWNARLSSKPFQASCRTYKRRGA